MFEYLIRTVADQSWPAVHATRLADVLIPAGSGWEQADGPGDMFIRNGDLTIEFSGEMVGWQLTIRGTDSDDGLPELVDLIADQVGAEVGQSVEVVEI